MDRRRLLIGLGTIVFGGSGFVASGAFDIGSLGSGGRGWSEVNPADIQEPTEDEPADPDDEDDDDHDPTGEIRIQAVTGPGRPGGRNRVGRLTNVPRVVESSLVAGDDDDFLEEIDITGANRRATTRIGYVADTGGAGDACAFLIANVGGVGQAGVNGQAVEVRMDLYSTPNPASPADARRFEGITFPYRIDRQRRGPDLLGRPVRLAPRETIAISIVIDGREATNLHQIDLIGISVRRFTE